jgi:hypothetical protein
MFAEFYRTNKEENVRRRGFLTLEFAYKIVNVLQSMV